jgi:hypothetical protein
VTFAAFITDLARDGTDVAVRKSGAVKTVTEGLVRAGGSLHQFYAKLQVTLSTYKALGRGNSAALVTVVSEPVTATVLGAVGEVSHVWTRTAADAQPWTIISPNSATTTFSTACDQGEEFTATFIDTVTDQAGQVLASTAVMVDCANIYYGGGYLGSAPPAPGREYP